MSISNNESTRKLMDYTTAWQNHISNSRTGNEKTDDFVCAEKTDPQLVELVLAGEKAVFEQIFERYKRLVASVARYYFQRPEQIEEVIQITFTKVYFELKNFNGEHEFSLAGWLKRITANACLDILRKQKRKPENLSCELADNELEYKFSKLDSENKTVEDFLAEKDLAEKLLAHLAAEDRAVLQMFYADGMSLGEISEITGWSCSKIKIRTFRARKSLRKIIRKYM